MRFFSLFALFGNTLILIALHKASFLHPPSKLLFSCLTTTDLFVGLVSQPLRVVFHATVAKKNWSGVCGIMEALSNASNAVLCGESITTLTEISVDRLMAFSNAGVQIQTGCDFNACSFICNILVDSELNFSPDLFVGQAFPLLMGLRMDFLLFNYFNLLLLKNLHDHSSPTSTNWGRRSKGNSLGASPMNMARYKGLLSVLCGYIQLYLFVICHTAISINVVGSKHKTTRQDRKVVWDFFMNNFVKISYASSVQ